VLVPYLWLAIFFLVPFLIVLKISLSHTAIAQPPYEPVLDPAAGWESLKAFIAGLSLENYAFIGSDWLYLASYLKSLEVASFSTVLLLLVGFPLAYGIARAPRRWQPALFMLVVLPFWTSFLIRIYAWINILQRDGLLNQLLLALRIVDEPPAWLDRYRGLYRHRLFLSAVHGAADLRHAGKDGRDADRGRRRSRLPLVEGVLAGHPAAGATRRDRRCIALLHPDRRRVRHSRSARGSQTMTIGQTLWTEFFANKDWPVAAAVAVVLLCRWSCRS
jgi:putrescine transport system permease protein